jgi:hypothetical protein
MRRDSRSRLPFRSYRLSGNLSVPDENTTGIVIQSFSPGEVGNVTVDLNGFAIRGVTVCTGFGSDTVCAPKGTGLQAAQRPLRAGLVGWHSAADAQVEVLPHEKAMSP